jgi:hypothetical protein
MTDDQAERLLKELRHLRHVAGLVAVAVCLLAMEAAVSTFSRAPDNTRPELSGIRAELQMLRGEIAAQRQPTPGPHVIVPAVPPTKPDAGGGEK